MANQGSLHGSFPLLPSFWNVPTSFSHFWSSIILEMVCPWYIFQSHISSRCSRDFNPICVRFEECENFLFLFFFLSKVPCLKIMKKKYSIFTLSSFLSCKKDCYYSNDAHLKYLDLSCSRFILRANVSLYKVLNWSRFVQMCHTTKFSGWSN